MARHKLPFRITKEEFELLKPKCSCPDHELIPWKESYIYQGIPKYIDGGHSRKGKTFTKEHRENLSIAKKTSIIKKVKSGKHYKITREEFDRLQPTCNCLDHELIPWKYWYMQTGVPRYIRGYHSKTYKIKITKEEFDRTVPHYCNCIDNCGQKITWKEHYKKFGIPKYKKGHHRIGKVNTQETRNKISVSNKGKQVWNKGTKGLQVSSMKGKKHKIESIEKMSKAKKGKPSPNKGKKMSSSVCKINSESHKGLPSPRKGVKLLEETKKKVSLSKTGKFRGPESPHWKGGISMLPYCYKFNRQLKEAVRNRDNRTCQLCNTKENGRKHSVHHIHYDKQNCYPDLITLCIKCNTKVNFNRDYYEELFMFMLWVRDMLYWTTKYTSV